MSLSSRKNDPDLFEGTAQLAFELETLQEWNRLRQSEVSSVNSAENTRNKSIMDIDQFIAQIKSGTMCAAPDRPQFNGFTERVDLDFSDHLWNFLQSTTSKDEIVDALTAIIEELEQARMFPLMDKENKSNFASVIRSSVILSTQVTLSDYQNQKQSIGKDT
jgi:RZZ complex, subunit zwilch